MLLRILSFALALVSLSAFANTRNEFKHALDSLHYELSVEWDQRDQKVFEEKIKSFQAQITALQQQGATLTDLQQALSDRTVATELKSEIQLLVSLGKLDSPAEIANFVSQRREDFYRRGASWNGEVLLTAGFLITLVAFIVGLAVLLNNYDEYICTEYSTTQTCSWTEDCMTNDEYGFCQSWGTPYESCSYACLNGYWQENK